MMVNPRFLSFLMPILAGGVLLWYKRRNLTGKEEKEGNDSSGESGGGGGGEDRKNGDPKAATTTTTSGPNRRRENIDSEDSDENVVLASSLLSLRLEDKTQPEDVQDDDDDDEPLQPMPAFDDNDNEIPSRRQSESADSEINDADADLSDVEFQQKRVLDWAEERVSISEADLDADLESLLQNCFNASSVDDSPSSRRLKMRQAHAVRAGSEASGVSRASTGSGDDSASTSWRHNSGGDENGLTPRSALNSLQNTPDVKKSPRNRRLKRSGGDESVHSTPSGKERGCPVISCTPSTPSSAVTSSGVGATPKKDGSDSDNWRANMGQWDELARSHNSPSDRRSEVSDDSGQGGSDGVPSLSIASPDDIVIYEFEFPSELCGRLIGKGGRNLQQLMIETNTRLALRKQPFTEDHQIVSVTGRQEDVQSVLQSVRGKFPRHRNPEVDLRPVQMPLPQDLLVPDIMPLSLPEDAPVEVIVSAVVSTAHIFLQMPTQPTFPNLPHLDACMLACYSQDGAPPLPTPIEAGVICAAPQSGGWYRAQIVEIIPSTTTTTTTTIADSDKPAEEASSFEAYVRFVDYGGYAYVPVTSLRQIRSDFIALPFQAVECYLAYMAPPNEDSYEFPIDGAFYLEQLVKDAAAAAPEVGGSGLKAETVAYAEGGIPCVYLYPSAGVVKGEEGVESQRKISINEALVAHGDAKWIPYYDGANVLGEEEKAELTENQQQQSSDIYVSTMTSSVTSSSFTEDDVVSAVVFTPRATLTSSSSSQPSVFDDELVKDTVEIDVQNVSQSQISGLKSVADCFDDATEDILSSLSSKSLVEDSSFPRSSSSPSTVTFQLDCHSEEHPELREDARVASQVPV